MLVKFLFLVLYGIVFWLISSHILCLLHLQDSMWGLFAAIPMIYLTLRMSKWRGNAYDPNYSLLTYIVWGV